MSTHAIQRTLTKESVVNQLVAQLDARRTLAARRHEAYLRLAQDVLGTTDQAFRLEILPSSLEQTSGAAA
jgi:hypothetical protein